MKGPATKLDEPTDHIAAKRPRWWSWATWLLMAVSVAWIVVLLRDGWPVLLAALPNMSVVPLVAAVLLCLAASAVKGENFFQAMAMVLPGAMSRRQSYSLQFVAQLVRNLPGRFWGVAYQLAQTQGAVPAAAIVAAHTVLAALAIYFTIWSAAIVLGTSLGIVGFCFILTSGAAGLALALQASRRVAHRLPRESGSNRWWRGLSTAARMISTCSGTAYLKLSTSVALGWGLYFAAWALLGVAYPGLDAADGLRLVAYYSIAWVAGFLAFFTPSGMGVRELVFLAIAADSPPEVLAATAVLGRVWLLLNDVVLGLVGIRGVQS